MAPSLKARLRAFSIHMATSLVVGLVLFLVSRTWYPFGLYELTGGLDGFMLTLYFGLLSFPFLTAVIYVPGKHNLRFDLITIGVLQTAVLAGSSYINYEQRPYKVIFFADNVQSYTKNELLEANHEAYEKASHIDNQWIAIDLPKNKGQVKGIIFAADFIGEESLGLRHELYMPTIESSTNDLKADFIEYLDFFSEPQGKNCHTLYLSSRFYNGKVCLNLEKRKFESSN